ncbi:hypothetical protein FE257_005559 [Aspergillus nanangensis]|uniref:Uncharacterized protein n=1 Tax=Aspergillus nanangensis TaxID=2582783 RepID=A0AAD4CQS5_ASPNN|nr:hypothetical protein FE257_005559 [Aspergillus nanangensis]
MSLHRLFTTDDDASSVYSRLSDTPKSAQSPVPLIMQDLPDIQPLDHQIYLARGSTIALETTRARLHPEGNVRVLYVIQQLRNALHQSREREARAEFEWKRQWNVPRIGGSSVRWI